MWIFQELKTTLLRHFTTSSPTFSHSGSGYPWIRSLPGDLWAILNCYFIHSTTRRERRAAVTAWALVRGLGGIEMSGHEMQSSPGTCLFLRFGKCSENCLALLLVDLANWLLKYFEEQSITDAVIILHEKFTRRSEPHMTSIVGFICQNVRWMNWLRVLGFSNSFCVISFEKWCVAELRIGTSGFFNFSNRPISVRLKCSYF